VVVQRWAGQIDQRWPKPPPEKRRGTDSESLGIANAEKPPRAGDRLAWTVTSRPSPIKAWRRKSPRGSRIAERRPGETNGGMHEGRPHGPTHASRRGHPKHCYLFEYDNRRFNAE
jgi:hypothetical protein